MPAVLLLFKGHPGVGKSTLARRVCQELQWPLIDKDDARDAMQSLPSDALQLLNANQLSYDIMFSYCRTQLSLGLSVVLDCPFARVALFDEADRLAKQYAAEIAVIDCIIKENQVWQQRLEERVQEQHGKVTCHKPQTWQQMQDMLLRYDGCWQWSRDGSRQLQHHLLIDTDKVTLEENVQAITHFVKQIRQQG